ncbi:MAG TPA: CsbD family protein [Longimicrobiaceae bacterium]|nr:CsbD family protein [Longimicrobiaceae bacterium]
MDRDLNDRGVENTVEGKGTELKGRVKDAVGGLTGDTGLQAEGKLDQLEGKVQGAVGKVQRNLDRDDDL